MIILILLFCAKRFLDLFRDTRRDIDSSSGPIRLSAVSFSVCKAHVVSRLNDRYEQTADSSGRTSTQNDRPISKPSSHIHQQYNDMMPMQEDCLKYYCTRSNAGAVYYS